MKNYMEFACILLHVETDMVELENHLSMMGYHYGIDKRLNLLFIEVSEFESVKRFLINEDIMWDLRTY